MPEPVISCIIPTFNRASLIKEAIKSTITQTYTNWELIIIDDSSTDNTENIVQSYICKDNRIKYFKNPRKGGAAARNFGLSKAIGEYIAFLDDDDINLPHRFESQIQAALKSQSGFIVSGYEIRERKSDKTRAKVKLELKGVGVGFPSRWLIKKELLEIVYGFDEEFPSMQDIEISYRLAEHESFVLHDDIVSVIYPTANSVSKRPENSIAGKILLMTKLDSIMPPLEAAAWYYNIATGLYSLSRISEAENFFRLASDNKHLPFILGNYYFNLIKSFSGRLRKINVKILQCIGKCFFPVIVKHQIVTIE